MTDSNSSHPARRDQGFSLIEVLIAVVVLSVGLLALASLQARLSRSGAESKVQTVALSLAQEKLEAIRAFGRRSDYGLINSEAAVTVTPPGAGGNFTVATTVTRQVWNPTAGAGGTGAFVAAGSVNGAPVSREFKEIVVQVGWENADGETRSVVLRDIVSVISPSDSAFVLSDSSSGKRIPQVRIYTPSDVGIIPIAIGNDRSAASSNPQPELSRRGSTTLTQFNVQTYVADIANGDPLLQRRVDFAGINCECRLDGVSTNANPGFEPTYWDGRRYVPPRRVPESAADNSSRPIGTSVTALMNQERFEEGLCTSCCRDHHDSPTAVTKVDPFRSSADFSNGDHNHYQLGFSVAGNGAVSPPLVADNNTTYHEVCRLVRVDGIFRVATDMRMENMTVLRMEDTMNGPIIPTSIIDRYAAFAKDFVLTAWANHNAASNTQPFPPPDDLLQTCTTSGGSTTCTGTAALGVPYDDLLDISETASVNLGPDSQFHLNARGLYIDQLSPATIEALGCIGDTGRRICRDFVDKEVLEIIPFVAVNLTKLADWGPPSGTISVSNEGINADGYSRGRVTATGSGQTDGFSIAYGGNAGLVNRRATDPEDLARRLRDAEQFVVASAGVSPTLRLKIVSNPRNLASFDEQQVGLRVTAPTVNPATCTPGTGGNRDIQTCRYNDVTETVSLQFSNYNVANCTACEAAQNGNQGWFVDAADRTVCRSTSVAGTCAAGVTDFKLCKIDNLPPSVTNSAPTAGLAGTAVETSSISIISQSGQSLYARSLSTANLEAVFAAQSATCP